MLYNTHAHPLRRLLCAPPLADSYTHGYLANQRDTSEAALRAELQLAEREHEDHASALRANSLGDYMRLERKLDEERQRHKHEANALTSDLAREKRKVADGTERIVELERRVTQLLEENAKLEGAWKREVSSLKSEMSSSSAKATGAHASEIARLEAACLRVTREKEALEHQLGGQHEQIEELRKQMENQERAAQLRVEEAAAEGQLEAARLQREIDKSKSLHTAALAAGSYKGRQLLYLDSLRAPPARAGQAGNREGRGSLSWRGLEEIHSLTRAMVGEAEAKRLQQFAQSVDALGGGEHHEVPSGFVPNASHEALGERFGSGDGDRVIVNRMLEGDYSAATGLVSHAHPSARQVMAQTPGRVVDVP